jgi:hypothetical protein
LTECTYKKYARQHDSCFEKSMGFGNLEYRNMATRNGRGNEGIPNTPLIHI